MRTSFRPLLVVSVVVALLAAASAAATPQTGPSPPQSERVRNGISHFDRAFYGFMPHKQDAEADRELDLASSEFERELAADPASAVAHRYLARIHALRRQHLEAARHYDRVSELAPLDVDACVLAALAYVDAGRLDEARTRIVNAQGRTADPAVLARLAQYLARLDAIER